MSINRNDNNNMNTNHKDNNINKETDKNKDVHQFENWMSKGKTEIQNEEINENYINRINK